MRRHENEGVRQVLVESPIIERMQVNYAIEAE